MNEPLIRYCWLCPDEDRHETLPGDYCCPKHRAELDAEYGPQVMKVIDMIDRTDDDDITNSDRD